MPQSIYTEDHEIFRDAVRRFMENEVARHTEEWEKNGQVSREVWQRAGQNGLLCATMPEQYGGSEADFLYSAIVIEEQGRVGATGPGFSLHSDISAPYLLHYGTDAIKERWLPAMASGEAISAIAMSEPAAGSDLQSVKTTAVKDGDEYVINGQKTFITNGQLCDFVIVVAKTDPELGARGTSLFVVECDRDGFSKGRNLKKVGLKAQDTSELYFENVRVPAENLLGHEGAGFMYLMQELPQERLVIGISAVAAAEAALRWTVQYVKEREAFGRPLAKFQNTRFKLADLDAEVSVGRAFLDKCIALHVEGELDVATAAKCKLWTTEMQCRVIDECVQLFGGYGYMWEYPIARAWADARVQRIYGGTSEIMREIVSRALLG